MNETSGVHNNGQYNTTLSLALGIIVSAQGQPLQILQVGFRSDSSEQ